MLEARQIDDLRINVMKQATWKHFALVLHLCAKNMMYFMYCLCLVSETSQKIVPILNA